MRLDERFSDLWAGLVHVVNNAIDHGIEDAGARALTSKPARASLTLRARLDDNRGDNGGDKLVIEVVDDGCGIDWGALAARAQERGLAATTDAERVAILFADGVSTKTTATMVSGRGIGLAAARAACSRLGGAIEVDSAVGFGCTFRFVVPVAGASA